VIGNAGKLHIQQFANFGFILFSDIHQNQELARIDVSMKRLEPNVISTQTHADANESANRSPDQTHHHNVKSGGKPSQSDAKQRHEKKQNTAVECTNLAGANQVFVVVRQCGVNVMGKQSIVATR